MEKRKQYQDSPSRFLLLVARLIGFLITGIFLLFMVPEFIAMISAHESYNEIWLFAFYAFSLTYGLGFLLSFWKVGLGGLILLISSIGITLFGFIDTHRWDVLFLLIPLSLTGILFLIYWKMCKKKIIGD
ncbi:DUF7670 domain-containing protein [Ancylomarina longa]|uniref:DUF7670 domain-containing protein n=1 Tax=Ancylomarina longa TaxID=2487017 RepID=A0A434AFX8_9BACT|nr:hypothetical protein [Ancylomarina longa]RUT73301.1 hypothetical protein DLK05_14105 [Ancylomarina longa]